MEKVICKNERENLAEKCDVIVFSIIIDIDKSGWEKWDEKWGKIKPEKWDQQKLSIIVYI